MADATPLPPPTAPAAPKALGAEGFTVGHLFGIELRVDWSLLVLFALVVFDLGAAVLPAWHPAWSPWLTWGLALATALLLLVSITVHELSHAIVARANHITVRRITLFVFGGMAEIEGEASTPAAELAMAVIGPVISIVLGFLSMSAATGLITAGQPMGSVEADALLRAATPLETLLIWLGTVNVMLGLFNLLPGFPLDGGRVLRAAIWAATRDRNKATRWASGVGRGIAWAMMGVGMLYVLNGAFGQGLWLLLIGWFLNNAARATVRRSAVKNALEHVPITRLMRTDFARVAPETTVERLVHEHLLRGDQHVFPVERDGCLLGIVSSEAVRALAPSEWAKTTVVNVMTTLDELGPLPPDAGADQAFERLARGGSDEVPVVERGHLVGVVERADMMRWIGLLG